MKTLSLSALYGEDDDDKHNKTYKVLKGLYPEFVDRMNELKSKPYPEFSKRFNGGDKSILYKQASFYGTYYEVQLMERIWKKLSDKKIPYLTIHDAVLVPESRKTNAVKIMEREAKIFFGYSPAIDAKKLIRPNLCKPKK